MAKVKDIEVDIIVTKGPNGPKDVSFDMDAGGGKTDRLEFKNQNHPGFLVYFNIVDRDNTGLRFNPDPANALWVLQGSPPACPPGPSTWEDFVPLSIEKQGRQLIVYNRNRAQADFGYTFWFLWPDGTPKDYDPIAGNQNGPRM